MKYNKLFLFFAVVLGMSQIFIGCKKSSNRVEIPYLGFSMQLPKGWQVDPSDILSFYEVNKEDDNWGYVSQIDLDSSETLGGYVDSLIADDKRTEQAQKEMLALLGEEADKSEYTETKIVSKTNRTISGLEAVELITQAEYTVIEVYIRKNDEVITVTMRTPKDDFSKYEPIFQKAIESINIK
jgi:hypothetical protein